MSPVPTEFLDLDFFRSGSNAAVVRQSRGDRVVYLYRTYRNTYQGFLVWDNPVYCDEAYGCAHDVAFQGDTRPA